MELVITSYHLDLKVRHKETPQESDPATLRVKFVQPDYADPDTWEWSFSWIRKYQGPYHLPLEDAKTQALKVLRALDIEVIDSPNIRAV